VDTESHSSLVAVIDPEADDAELDRIVTAAARLRPGVTVTNGDGWSAVALGERSGAADANTFLGLPGVLRVVSVLTPYRLAALEVFGSRRPVAVPPPPGSVGGPTTCVGGGQPLAVMAACSGPVDRLAFLVAEVRRAGATLLFGGEFPPRHDRVGPERRVHADALKSLAAEHGLGLCLEVSDAANVAEASEVASMLQVGSRNMQDFRLLGAVGQAACPVLLKRGPGATLEEFILAAEYVLIHGNGRVLLCESGIRTFDAVDRPRLEISALPLIRWATHLPVLADASGASRDGTLAPAVARASAAAGADGLVVEVTAGEAVPQSAAIDIQVFGRLMEELQAVAAAAEKSA
jgi:3-deoxy-7-phosphoheptulonate synthase